MSKTPPPDPPPYDEDPAALAADAAFAFNQLPAGTYEEQHLVTRRHIDSLTEEHLHLHPDVVGTEHEIQLLSQINLLRHHLVRIEELMTMRN